jgi:hypothetical protein
MAIAALEQPIPDGAVPSLVPEYGLLNGEFERDRAVAVIGEPFAGRELVLDHVTDRLGARQFRLAPDADPDTVVDRIDEGPVVVGDCQHLYRRVIGGFEGLETVLNALARTEETVVTGWNSTAWSYLDAVHDIGDRFQSFELEPLAGAKLGEILREEGTGSPSFQHEEKESIVGRKEVSIGRGDLTVPAPSVNVSEIRRRITKPTDPETAVYERLATITDGNLGVALSLWHHERPRVDLMPGDFSVPFVEVNREAAFLLRRILAKETTSRARLADEFGSNFDQLVGALVTGDLITDDGESLSLEPAGVPAAIELTEKQRIL